MEAASFLLQRISPSTRRTYAIKRYSGQQEKAPEKTGQPKNKKIFPKEDQIKEKMASDLHRTAQPHTFAMFPSWRILQELVV
jgi:hypothetical protein